MPLININIYKYAKRKSKLKGWHPKEVFFFINQKTKGTILMQSAKVDQKFTATWPGPKDKYDNDAAVQDVQFVSDDPSIADIVAAPGGNPYAAIVTTKSKVGATMVRIKADADLGEGVKTIEGTLSVEVLAGDATGFADATATEPEDNLDTPE